MASRFAVFVHFILFGSVSNAWPNPQKFMFDPSSPPGPSQECSQGIPRMAGPIPFPPNTPLNDDNIGYWVERYTECVWGNYFNNVEHIDYATLGQNVDSPNWKLCYRKTDGTERCISNEQHGQRSRMIRDVLDVTAALVEVIEVNERSITIVANGSLTLQVQMGAFQVGHAFQDGGVETFEFNDDGSVGKQLMYNEDDLMFDMMEWAEKTLRGYGDYLKVDHANKHKYYRIDLGDTGVRVFIGFLVLWLILAPIGMVYIAMKYCNGQKVNKYSKVNVDAEA